MRDIEFRAKMLHDSEWVFGFVKKHTNNVFIINNKFTSGIEVDINTVGQYTGLKDKNGTKIFEGDIVKGTIVSQWAKEEIVCCVEYQNSSFICIEQGKWGHNLRFAKNIEVIGNIYDNPELLKGGA